MPNWVKHNYEITGPEDELRKFVEECFTENNFDFEKIIPRPEGFNTELVSPMPECCAVFSDRAEAARYREYTWVKEAGMADVSAKELAIFLYKRNGCNYLSRTMEDLRASIGKKVYDDTLTDFQILREIQEVLKKYADNIRIGGASTWYDWNIENWGCKWNAASTVLKVFDNKISLAFNTAWAVPDPIMEKFHEYYPNLKISGTVDEEGGYFWYVLKDNSEVESGEGCRPGGPYDYEDEPDLSADGYQNI